MSFPLFSDLQKLTNEAITSEILDLKKQLFDLRLKKATRQSFKPHLFKHTKRRIAQLQTLETQKNQVSK